MNTAIDRVLRVPGFALGAHVRAEPIADAPAGKGVNISRALAKLGRPSIVTGFVGQRDAERFAVSLCGEEHVARIDNHLVAVRGATRENITIFDPDNGTDTHLRAPGFTVTRDDLARLSNTIERLARQNTVVIFTGSLPPGMDRHVLAGLVSKALANGARVVLDLNGEVLGLVLEAVKKVWLVSPNRSELAEALGEKGTLPDGRLLTAARSLHGSADTLLLSLGAQGAMLVTHDGAWRGMCAIDARQIVSTVGAGDCLLAGVVDGCLNGMTPEETLRHGLGVASTSILSADPAGIDQGVVQKLKQTATVQRLL